MSGKEGAWAAFGVLVKGVGASFGVDFVDDTSDMESAALSIFEVNPCTTGGLKDATCNNSTKLKELSLVDISYRIRYLQSNCAMLAKQTQNQPKKLLVSADTLEALNLFNDDFEMGSRRHTRSNRRQQGVVMHSLLESTGEEEDSRKENEKTAVVKMFSRARTAEDNQRPVTCQDVMDCVP
eukprot:TRINITY_DN21228_c1_g1_i2.p2 TRINITY_DN21228_c1_g1~~TRINITY_DN21228_c1_g1_i2.p2  ORF type:complete len:181 (+),score=53.22 TRINITY_DN21228_c1_g1_i2:653-1195(+)